MKILLTGGAGFIGSCILRTLNDMGENDIVIVDNIANSGKWRNLVNKRFTEYIHKTKLFECLYALGEITHVIHIGACSSTTETDFDYLYSNNTDYSKRLWQFCAERGISFIYASSAYGGGEDFSDDGDITSLRPLNGYGYSKQLFDLWVESQRIKPKQCVGLKFFNVYGPNEYHKGSMASVIFHGFNQIKETGKIKLFKSHKPNYSDGGQKRDFVYVKDICEIIRFFIEHSEISGLFNAGTGKAESFETLGKSIFKALKKPENIEYIDMPEHLRDKYQYFTEAKIDKLRNVGYNLPFRTLESGVDDYVKNYLYKEYKVF